jgi:hypothetical protein
MLPDDVLLEIFEYHRLVSRSWDLYKLTHVCKRWRAVIFESPNRLKLQLVYTYRRPVRRDLDFWPDLPLSICYSKIGLYRLSQADEENVIAVLKYPGRICKIDLNLTRPLLEKLTPLMRVPFPVLNDLQLDSRDLGDSLVLPSTFLCGSTPRLRSVNLKGIAFPTLPQLIVTACDLVSLRLSKIPYTGYFSPEALVNSLDSTPKLEVLIIDWTPSTLRQDKQSFPCSPCPQTHVVLPALTEFQFRGDNEYLEGLISRINTPNVEYFEVSLFEQRTFDLPELVEFIGRTEELTSSPYQTSIGLWERSFSIGHYFGSRFPTGQRIFRLQIPFHDIPQKTKLLIHVWRQFSPLLSNVRSLNLGEDKTRLDWRDEIDAALWLELFAQFGGVRKLQVFSHLLPSVALALEQSARNTDLGCCEVLPSLQHLYLISVEPPLPIESFLAARRRSGRAVSIHYEEMGDEGLHS